MARAIQLLFLGLFLAVMYGNARAAEQSSRDAGWQPSFDGTNLDGCHIVIKELPN